MLRKPQVTVGTRRDRVRRLTDRKFHHGSGGDHAPDLEIRRIGEPDVAVRTQGQPCWLWLNLGCWKRILSDVAQAGVADTGVPPAGVRPNRTTADVRGTANRARDAAQIANATSLAEPTAERGPAGTTDAPCGATRMSRRSVRSAGESELTARGPARSAAPASMAAGPSPGSRGPTFSHPRRPASAAITVGDRACWASQDRQRQQHQEWAQSVHFHGPPISGALAEQLPAGHVKPRQRLAGASVRVKRKGVRFG
jgi:hypothetical protein